MAFSRHLDALSQDLRYSVRFLLRARAFTATVLITLALSIGSTAAVFTLVEVLLLRPLPVRSPGQLFSISAPGRNLDLNPSYYSHLFFEHLRDSSPLFRNLIAASTALSSGINLTDGAVTERVRGEIVSGNYFDVLGVGAEAGRVLTAADDRTPGGHPVLVLSYAFWQRRFSGASDVVGRTVLVSGIPFTVVGVARQGFFGARPGFGPDLWAPLMMVQQLTSGAMEPRQRLASYLELLLRLDANVDVRQAQEMAGGAYARWLDQTGAPAQRPDRPTLQLTPASAGHSLLRGQYRQPLLLLMAAVMLLLLIACANVAMLLIARATARAREMAVRTAVGATRLRLVRQTMTESLLLGVLGGACGWIVSLSVGRTLVTFLPASAESWQFAPNPRIFAFTLLLSLGSGLLFGLAPVVHLRRDTAAAALKSGSSAMRIGRWRLDSRAALVVVQVALAMLLVMGADLTARTLRNLKGVDMGFGRDGILLVSIDPARSGYPRARTAVFFDQLVQRLRAHGGVGAVGLASHGTLSSVLPVGTRFISNEMHADGAPPPPTADLVVYNNFVSPGYFDSVGISLLRGRDFAASDRPETVQVAIVNEAAARLLVGRLDPIGRRIGRGTQGPAEIEIVGLVENAKYLSVREAPLPTVYFPFRGNSPMTVHVKTRGDARSMVPIVQGELRALDGTLPVFQVQTLEARVDDALRQERLVATLAVILSGLGTLIAGVGIYGLISFSVAQRTLEIGIRMAVGAHPHQILLMMLRRALAPVALGIVVGLPLAVSVLRVAASFFYGVSPSHPSAVADVVLILTGVALLAGLFPALTACRTEPRHVLRHD